MVPDTRASVLQGLSLEQEMEPLLRQLPRHAGQACTVVLSQVERELSHAEVSGQTGRLDALWSSVRALVLSLARARGADGMRLLALEDMDAVFV